MKRLFLYLFAFIFTLSLGLTTYAKESKNEEAKKDREFITQAGVSPLKSKDIIGSKVEDPSGNNLGRITEIAVEPKTGRVAFVVIEHGGAGGFGSKQAALPFSDFSVEKDKEGKIKTFVLNMNKERLEKAPKFDKQSWGKGEEVGSDKK